MRSPIRPKNRANESVPDEHNLSKIAKSNSAIPRPTFFNVVSPSKNNIQFTLLYVS